MPDLPIEDVILQFAVVIAAALAVQLIFDRTRLPGIIGLLFNMFMAGVEIDLDIVRNRKRESASFGIPRRAGHRDAGFLPDVSSHLFGKRRSTAPRKRFG